MLTGAILAAICALGSLYYALSHHALNWLLALLTLVLGIALNAYGRQLSKVRFTQEGVLDIGHGESMLWSEITEAHYDTRSFILYLTGANGRKLGLLLGFAWSADDILAAVREHLPPTTFLT